MWPFSSTSPPSSIDQDFITRYWDLKAQVDGMQLLIDDQLHEIENRYKRAEQSERRLAQKREEGSPCADEEGSPAGVQHPSIIALKKRQHKDVAQTRADPLAG